jgi:hypothetical protein
MYYWLWSGARNVYSAVRHGRAIPLDGCESPPALQTLPET